MIPHSKIKYSLNIRLFYFFLQISAGQCIHSPHEDSGTALFLNIVSGNDHRADRIILRDLIHDIQHKILNDGPQGSGTCLLFKCLLSDQFDGIINNLPDEPPAGTPDPARAAREAGEAAERRSVLEKLREEERARPPRPPRPFLPDREERSLE